MDATDCITNETWLRYAAGTLDKAGVTLVHRHVATCEICADILEGIQHMEKPALLTDQVNKINTSVELISKPKTFRLNPTWYAAAAILLATLGLGWYLLNPPLQQPIALQQPETDKEKPVQPKQETVRNKDLPADASPPEITLSPKAELPVKNQAAITIGKPVNDNEQTKALSNAEQSLSIADASTVNADQDFSQEKQPIEPENKVVAESIQDDSKKVVATKKSKAIYPSAYSNNNNNNNAASSNTNNNFRSVSTIPDSVLYQKALIKFNAKQYDSCNMILLNLVMSPSSLYYEDGMLLLAKNQIAKGEKSKAIQTLQTVIRLNENRKNEAEALLNSLK